MDIGCLEAELRKNYRYRIELHAHTYPGSMCSEITPAKLVEIYSRLNYDAVVITNHFIFNNEFFERYPLDRALDYYMKEYEDAADASKQYGIKVLLGTEIRFAENNNDYLIYGVERNMLYEIYPYLQGGVETFRKDYKMPNSVFIQAHPFREGSFGVNPKLLDGVELNFHQGHNSRISTTVRFADENNIKIITAGSDTHHLNRNYMGIEGSSLRSGYAGASALLSKIIPNNSFELAKILKSGDYLLEISGNTIVIP